MYPLVRRSPIALDDCTLAKSIELIGDRWTLLILRSAMFGLRRFDDFQKELGTPRTVLSGRLKILTDAGLMTKQAYKEDGKRPRPEYVLTKKAHSLRPILIALMQWGDEWLADGTSPIKLTDPVNRQKVKAGFVDASGQEVPAERLRIAIKR